MSSQPHDSKIDYLAHSKALIGRPGKVFNIITGCQHGCGYCYARQMVEYGRLKDHPAYPYGFAPTYHYDRMIAVGIQSKWLIFLNDMGDVGGNWEWRFPEGTERIPPKSIAARMRNFALLNPQHILLLLTKNPSWYGLVGSWPDNVWCGFTATNNEEYERRFGELLSADFDNNGCVKHWWASLEPWMDTKAPIVPYTASGWIVVGGLSGRNSMPVSPATGHWINRHVEGTHGFKLFVKDNAQKRNAPREYPDEWKVSP